MYDFPRVVRNPVLHRFKNSFCLPLSISIFPLSDRVRTYYPIRINPFRPVPAPPRLERPKASQAISMAANKPHPKSKRPTCPDCSKPARFCLCARLRTRKLDNSVSVTILQHSLEKKHHLNSTRIAKLGLMNLNVLTVCDVSFESLFVISSASSLDQDGSEGSGVGRVSDERETSKLDFDGSSCKVENGSRSEITKSGIGDFNSMPSSELLADGFGSNEAMNGGAEEMTFFTAKIGKYGVTSDGKKQDFHGNAPPWLAVSEGFTVRKFQTRNVEGADEFEEYEEFELKVPAGSAVLFPTENAVGIDEVKMMHFEVKNLIVLDGTWAKAKRMYAENPWLKLLPHLRLDVDRMSLYGEVRQQPKEGYLSTIESIVHSLKALGEDQEGLEGLLDVFESMVADQRRCKDERLNKVSMN